MAEVPVKSAAQGQDECERCGFLHAPDRSCEDRSPGLYEGGHDGEAVREGLQAGEAVPRDPDRADGVVGDRGSELPLADPSAATVDPRVRKDGLCAGANCRKPRTAHRNPASGKTQGAQKATRLNKKLWLHELEHDPFCSSRCARRYHGVVYQSDAAGDDLTAARERAGRSAADRYRTGVS